VKDRLALPSCRTTPEEARFATVQVALGEDSTTGDSDCHLVLRKSWQPTFSLPSNSYPRDGIASPRSNTRYE